MTDFAGGEDRLFGRLEPGQAGNRTDRRDPDEVGMG